jgi:hypothetical protein
MMMPEFEIGIEKIKGYFPTMKLPNLKFFYKEVKHIPDKDFTRLIDEMCSAMIPPKNTILWIKRTYAMWIHKREEQEKIDVMKGLEQNDRIGARYLRLVMETMQPLNKDQYKTFWAEVNKRWARACNNDSDKEKDEVLEYGEKWLKHLIKENEDTVESKRSKGPDLR